MNRSGARSALLLAFVGAALTGCPSESGRRAGGAPESRAGAGEGNGAVTVSACSTRGSSGYADCFAGVDPGAAAGAMRMLERLSAEGDWDGALLGLPEFRNWSGLGEAGARCIQQKICKEVIYDETQ